MSANCHTQHKKIKKHFDKCDLRHNCLCELKKFSLVFFIAFSVFLIELVGGIISNSLALLADAWHVLIDASSVFVAIVVSYYISKGLNEKKLRKTSGYINAGLLLAVSLWIIYEAIARIFEPREINSWIMISIAILGTVGNYIQHKILDHMHDENITHESVKFHVLSDLLQSIAVVIGGVLIMTTGFNLIDPILSLIIGAVMLRWTYVLSLRIKKC